MDATTEFNLIGFLEVRSAAFSPARIARSRLRDRMVFARTSRGNYAKFQVHSGDDLRITRLTLYDPRGCIIKAAYNLVIRNSFSCDLDEARETRTGSDFWWHGVRRGVHFLEPAHGAVFHQVPSIDDVGFAEVRDAPYERRRIERPALRDQLLYCRTSQGRYAKLLVHAGDTLRVSRLVVHNADGTPHLDESNIDVPSSRTLDLDTGEVGASGRDLWWHAETSTRFFLEPMNGAELSFDSYFRFEKYLPLIRSQQIRAAMVFEDGDGVRDYPGWSDEQKLQLRETVYTQEIGADLPITGPPILSWGRYMQSCDAWKIYLAHVAQSLWVEANGRVGWGLGGASPEHLEHLFDSRKLFGFLIGSGHSFEFFVMGAVTHWNPRLSYDFLHGEGLIGADHWQTIQRLAEWIRAHLMHITGYMYDHDGGPFATQADQWEYIFGYEGLPLVERMISPLPDRRHITHGCWGTDGFFAAVLRTVNIPVRHGRSNFSGASHSRPEFFTVGQNLSHGDDPYNGWIRLGHNNVPINEVFMDDALIVAEIDSPPALPGMTVAETASHNKAKYFAELGVRHKTNWLLRLRCHDVASGSSGPGSRVWNALHDFYTNAEVTTIEADCDAAIAAIPGGCGSI